MCWNKKPPPPLKTAPLKARLFGGGLASGDLVADQVGLETAGREKRVMVAIFDHATGLEHDNLIRVPHG